MLFFAQPEFEGLLGGNLFKHRYLAAQIADLSAGHPLALSR
jgi:hypothetical protein